MNENWLPIIGYEGYEVSNYGNVRSLGRIQIVTFKPEFTYKYYNHTKTKHNAIF